MSLLELLKTINRVLDITQKLMGLFQTKEIDKWLDQVESAIDQLQKAKTQNDKYEAARTMVNLIRDVH